MSQEITKICVNYVTLNHHREHHFWGYRVITWFSHKISHGCLLSEKNYLRWLKE